MPNHYTPVELTKRWVELTGTPEKEVRQRVKVLRQAGMLPDGRAFDGQSLDNYQIALFIVASCVAYEHVHVIDGVHSYADLVPDRLQTNLGALEGKPLVAAMAVMMGMTNDSLYPIRVLHILFSQTQKRAELTTLNTRTNNISTVYYGSMSGNAPAIERSVTLHGDVILGMAA